MAAWIDAVSSVVPSPTAPNVETRTVVGLEGVGVGVGPTEGNDQYGLDPAPELVRTYPDGPLASHVKRLFPPLIKIWPRTPFGIIAVVVVWENALKK